MIRMMKTSTCCLLLWSALATTFVAASAFAQNRSRDRDRDRTRDASPQPAATESAVEDRYEILIERNIFRRDRTPSRRATEGTRESSDAAPSAPRRPEEYFILTGIALQEGRHVAFVEDTRTSQTTRMTPGKALATGKIVRVHADHVEYEAGGKATLVAIGRNFAGDRPAATSPAPVATQPVTRPRGTDDAVAGGPSTGGPSTGAPATEGPSTGPSTAPASADGPPVDDSEQRILERMKLRRMQETGR